MKQFYEEYYDLFTFKIKPIHEDYVLLMAHELRKFGDHEDTYRIGDYYLSKGIGKTDFYRLVDKHRCLREARDYTKERIASRRELGALFNKLNAGVAMRYLPMYDQDIKEIENWRSSLNTQNKSESTKIEVIIPPIKMKD